jgi:hypothetical protein
MLGVVTCYISVVVSVLGMEARALHRVGKHSSTELQPQPHCCIFKYIYV